MSEVKEKKEVVKKQRTPAKKKATFKNSVKGKSGRHISISKSYVAFSLIAMIAEALVIVVLLMVLTTISNGPKYVVNDDGEVVAVRQDKAVKNGAVLDTDRVQGKRDSKVAFVWYVDMQCPACAQMAPVVQMLYEKYGDKVAFVTRNLVISGHVYARPAAIAVEAAGKQGFYWEMLMEMFQQRSEWAYVNSDDLLTERLAKIFLDASDEKGNKEQFLADLKDESLGAKIDADEKLVREDGLNSTPSIIIDGMDIDFAHSNESTVNILTDAIEKALEK